MVIRVIAGVVPMICGALIYSGAVPVRQWIYGSAWPSPVDAAHMMQQMGSQDLERLQTAGPGGDPAIFREMSGRPGSMTPDQARLIHEAWLRRQAETRAASDGEHNGSSRGGWNPSGGGWGR
jgi:hypothetical protein